MPPDAPTDPLHGVTLQRMLTDLVENVGWEAMAERVPVRCFTNNPSVSSSLAFLRRTPWARAKVEQMYIRMVRRRARGAVPPEARRPPGAPRP